MLRESDLLDFIYRRSVDLGSAVVVGPGDDAAVVHVGPDRSGRDLLLTTDQLIEGRHYPPATPIDLVARKAIARCVSDIAAMAGQPRFALATAALRPSFDKADDLFDAMATWAAHWACPIVGGDIATTEGPAALAVTIIGEPHAARGPVLRSGATAGDSVCVTGALGGSLASGRHLTFEPRLAEAAWLADTLGDRLGAMIDLSDGLGRDAGRIAAASNVRIVLEQSAIPLAETITDWRAALGDGEDYELCFTVTGEPPRRAPTGAPISVVGVVEPGSGCFLRPTSTDGDTHNDTNSDTNDDTNDSLIDVANLGWDHGA